MEELKKRLDELKQDYIDSVECTRELNSAIYEVYAARRLVVEEFRETLWWINFLNYCQTGE